MKKLDLYTTLLMIFIALSIIGVVGLGISVYFLLLLIPSIILAFVMMTLAQNEIGKAKKINPTQNRTQNLVKNVVNDKLQTYLAKLENLSKPSVQLVKTQNKTFSKFGGMPIVPKEFKWPMFKNKPIPFLLQIDFSEINKNGTLKNFPTEGLLYVFVNSAKVNFEEMEDEKDFSYKVNETFKILYYNTNSKLKQIEKQENLKYIYKEFYVTKNYVKTYPDYDDSKEVQNALPKNDEIIVDAYNNLREKSESSFMLGGYRYNIQENTFLENLNNNISDDYVLLLKIDSLFDDENFVWGDLGTINFYIKQEDLKNCNFDNVVLEMQTT